MASKKVGRSFAYHVAVRTGLTFPLIRPSAIKVTNENTPNSAGVDRAMARSFHCRSSFYPDMRSGFLKGYLHSPTAHEPGQDLRRRMIGVRQNEGLGVEFALWVAYQHPVNGEDRPRTYSNLVNAKTLAEKLAQTAGQVRAEMSTAKKARISSRKGLRSRKG